VTDRTEDVARGIVQEHIDWHRHGRPRPTGGFPPEFFADELQQAIASALRDEREAARREEVEACVATAMEVANFGDLRWEELTRDYGQPRYDLLARIVDAIRSRRPHPPVR
jgi:hypothetical protein